MVDEIKVACIDQGIKFEKPKTAPIGSESLKKVSEFLLRKNTLDAMIKDEMIYDYGIYTINDVIMIIYNNTI
jgi:hypothetical protein